ncbi:MAG: RDD family protein [Prevotella sp.]|nr:RDD family protein [Prevotella sp.]
MITGQYVNIQPTVASVGDRIFAQIIDWVVMLAYIVLVVWLVTSLDIGNEWYIITFLALVPLFYTLLFEIFNQGQSLGKMAMKMQVVKLDGTMPTLGSYLMRWLLYLIDGPATSFMGLLAMILSRNNQRLGDMAAGTVVIKKEKYKKIQVSLDEYDYLMQNYRPRYPQAADLSLEQVEIITRAIGIKDIRQMAELSRKVRQKLGVERKEKDDAAFLQRIVRDYQYYALEEI